jgi:hypothetical protein
MSEAFIFTASIFTILAGTAGIFALNDYNSDGPPLFFSCAGFAAFFFLLAEASR